MMLLTEVSSLLRCSCIVDPTYTQIYIEKLGFKGVYIIYFFTFALKHRLWVLVRTASLIYSLSKNKEKYYYSSFLQ